MDFCDSGAVDSCQIESNLIVSTPVRNNFDITLFDASEKEYKVNGTTIKPAITGDYDINTSSISGLTISNLKKLSAMQLFSSAYFKRAQFNSPYGTVLRMRLYVERNDLAEIQKLGIAIPDGMVGKPVPYYNEVKAAAEVLAGLNMGELSSLTFQQLLPKYTNTSPVITGQRIAYHTDKVLRATESAGVPVEVPWPCYVVKPNDYDGWAGLSELANGSGINNKLLGRLYTNEEYAAIWQKYQASGPVKVLFHPQVADRVKATFVDLANFYGKDIIIMCPAFCIFSCVRGKHDKYVNRAKTGISAHYARAAVDFDWAHERTTKTIATSEIGKYKDSAYKAALEIFEAHGAIWGGDSPTFYEGSYYDPMHFGWA